jgi:hypothetical protein
MGEATRVQKGIEVVVVLGGGGGGSGSDSFSGWSGKADYVQ